MTPEEQAGAPPFKKELGERVREVIESRSENFSDLVRLGGLDPKRHLRFADWSGVDFSGCDLRGYDFTGARLRDCNFAGARIGGARFDQAEINGANLRAAKDWKAYAKGWRRAERLPPDNHLPTGAAFQDAPFAPEMAVVPAGKFLMGSPPDEPERYNNEGPQHEVTIPKRFAVGRFAVTFDEWDAAFAAGGVTHKPEDEGWGHGRRPVTNVSWDDAKAYIAWLSEAAGRDYRLLSEAEWEYACRAGTSTPFWWGASITPEQANYDGNYTYNGGSKGAYRQKTSPVESFQPNPWGLYQMHGNVWEWCEDCWNDSYKDAPTDGSARTAGDCSLRVLRGGAWDVNPRILRAAFRLRSNSEIRNYDGGFRVARTLNL